MSQSILSPDKKVRSKQLPPVFFLHVTKCGGTSLRAAFIKAFIERGEHPLSLHQLDAEGSTATARVAGMETFALRDLLLATELRDVQKRFITGHYRYTESLHRPLMENAISVTVLREPVDRFLSLYFYNRYKDNDYGRESLELADYISKPRARRSAEDYVRIFRGTGTDHGEFVTSEETQAAIRNLEAFDAVGRLEQLDSFCEQVQSVSSLPINVPRLNSSPAPAASRYADLPADLFAEIEALCEPSTRVYNAIAQVQPLAEAQ